MQNARILTAILAATWTHSIHGSDGFAPVEAALLQSRSPEAQSYFTALRRTVLRRFSDDVPGAFCALPSFRPEWSIRFGEFHQEGYRVYLVTASQSVWSVGGFGAGEDRFASMDDKTALAEVAPIERSLSLDRTLGRRIVQAWHAIAFSASFQRRTSSIDGVHYFFFAADIGSNRAFAAEASTPSPDSAPGLLANLAMALRSLVQDEPNALSKVEGALRQIEQRPNKAPLP